MKRQHKILIICMLVLVFFFYSAWYYGSMMQGNSMLCSDYWNEECSGYNTFKNLCYCDGGQYLTTSDMIRERNEQNKAFQPTTKNDAAKSALFLQNLVINTTS